MKNLALLSGLIFFCAASFSWAHPIPSNQHDRTVVVRLQHDPATGRVTVRIEYRLELDEATAQLDLAPLVDEVDYQKARQSPLGFYAEFTRLMGPILAGRLSAKANGQSLDFACQNRNQRLSDEKGQALGHLRCDFVFQASFSPLACQDNVLTLEDKNYQDQTGLIHLSLLTEKPIRILDKSEADEALKKRPLIERSAEDEKKLRQLSARLGSSGSFSAKITAKSLPKPAAETPSPQADSTTEASEDHSSLFRLFMHSEHGFWLLMVLAAGIGAVHALTPGHGKTLVAAYLVGQHGTAWHALVLGVITTLTHTGAVLLLAVVLLFVSDNALATIQKGLGLAMGLLVACLGLWLLLGRLSGRADHIHLGGGHHHHHHGHHHHSHEHPHTHHHHESELAQGKQRNQEEGVSWWGLVVLGMSGGIVPCWDAIAMLVLALGSRQLWLALPTLLAFSAGLAGVLVAIGIVVVQVRSFASSRWGEGRFIRSLPLVSALVVTAMGLWLCYDSIHASPAPPQRAAQNPAR